MHNLCININEQRNKCALCIMHYTFCIMHHVVCVYMLKLNLVYKLCQKENSNTLNSIAQVLIKCMFHNEKCIMYCASYIMHFASCSKCMFSRSKAYGLGPSTIGNSVCLMSDVCDNFEPCDWSTRFMRVISLQ